MIRVAKQCVGWNGVQLLRRSHPLFDYLHYIRKKCLILSHPSESMYPALPGTLSALLDEACAYAAMSN
jgi:hypothetical protein